MTKSLETVLGYVPLTGVIQAVKTGIPDVLPAEFNAVGQRVIGNKGRYTVLKGTRQTARRSEYGAPAINRALIPIDLKDVILAHSFEMIELDPLTLQMLRAYNTYEQDMGRDEVDRQELQFATLFDNLGLAMKYSMLGQTFIWFDAGGNLLPNSTGSVNTIDYGVSANNRNQINGVINASWVLANTDIPSQLRGLHQTCIQLTGYDLHYAFYGKNIPSYLTNNSYVKEYLSRNVPMASRFLNENELPEGLFGFKWIPVYTSFYVDQNGVVQTLFGDDFVTFCPKIDKLFFENIEGSYKVPTTFNPMADAMGALNSAKDVYGKFSYACPTHNPLGVQLFAGWTGLPIYKVPDTLFVADVAF